MTNETEESLREEWKQVADRANDFTTYLKISGSRILNPEAISDWWLEKLDQALKSQREEIVASCPIIQEMKQEGEYLWLKIPHNDYKNFSILPTSLIQNK